MAVLVSDPRFWNLLKKEIETRRDRLTEDIKRGIEQTAYLKASGEITGLEFVLQHARRISAKMSETEDT